MREVIKNQQEIAVEEACWAEIEEVLKRFNCRIEGQASYTDYDYDCENEITADTVYTVSLDYENRVKEAHQKDLEEQKALAIKETEDIYKKILEFSHLKDLKPFHVGKPDSRYTWFEGLKLNVKKVKKPLFFWNGNKFWQYSKSYKGSDGVSLIVGDKSDWRYCNGAPLFSFFAWEPFKKDDAYYAEWFTYKEGMNRWVLIDMYCICLIIDLMLKEGVLEFEKPTN